MTDRLNILIVGVGGQGTLLASRILGALADELDLDCKLSEVHGMAQRGGSVVTHVKIAKKVNSPIIARGDADIILAFEKLEALRYIDFLKKDGIIVVNVQEILPMPVITGSKEYPADLIETMKKTAGKVVTIDALDSAKKLGNVKTVNVVMLGALAKYIGIEKEVIKSAVRKSVKSAFVKMNEDAVDLGFEM